jgi:hypothetical protein
MMCAFLTNIDQQLKRIHESINPIQLIMEEELAEVKMALSADLANANGSLIVKILQLVAVVDHAIQHAPNDYTTSRKPEW